MPFQNLTVSNSLDSSIHMNSEGWQKRWLCSDYANVKDASENLRNISHLWRRNVQEPKYFSLQSSHIFLQTERLPSTMRRIVTNSYSVTPDIS